MLVTGAVAVTIAVGLIAKHFGVDWRAETQPFYIFWDPVFTAWALLSAAALTALLFAAFRLARSAAGAGPFAFAVFGLALLSRLVLNLARSGPRDWYHVYVTGPTGDGDFEYLPALSELGDGVGPFLDNFASLVPNLPVHPAGHPPGMLLLLHYLGISSPEAMAALTIAIGAVAAPLLYVLGRELFEERTARLAALLFVFVPTSMLYGATSADALFATLGLAAAICLLSKRKAVILGGAFLLALASFFSYALLAAGGWAGLVTWRRDGFRAMLRIAILCAAVLVAFYGLFALATGFDVIASIQALNERYHDGIANVRPFWFWMFGSPAAFLFMLGPVAWFAARSLGSREITAVSLAAVITVTVLLGVTKAETERIWLFMVPLASLAAARALPDRMLRPVLIAMTVQAFVIEIIYFTVW